MRDFRLLIGGVSFLVALIATIFISLIRNIPGQALWIVFFTILLVTGLLLSLIFRIFIVTDIRKVTSTVRQMMRESVFDHSRPSSYNFRSFKKIDKDIHEIAELKSFEIDELKKMEGFRKDFLANISHELKTPIFASQGFVHTLLDGAVKDKNVRNRFLKKAAKSLDGLDLLVRDLLILSQIEIGDVKMQFEYFDIYKLVEEVFDQLEEPAGKRKVTLQLSPNEGQFIVYADFMRIQQVLSNLVENGIKYNKEGGNVVVKLKGFRNWVTVKVVDSGEGIAEDHWERIFERFYRVDKSRSRKWGGTGLGLSIVKQIMEGHHSDVKVNSEVGKGSSFSFRLVNNKEHVLNEEVGP